MLKWLAAAAATGVVLPLALVLLVTANPAISVAGTSTADGPSVLALTDIPPTYLAWYMGAARTCPGLPWGVLAGIGKVESDHGQSTAPGVRSGANFAGAEGPMQFEPATFARYATDGDHDGQLSPYDPGDAIYTAASMLCANGAAAGTPAGLRQAVFAYNHSWAYVDAVLSWAARYTVPTPSATAETAIAFALRQAGKPYQWGRGRAERLRLLVPQESHYRFYLVAPPHDQDTLESAGRPGLFLQRRSDRVELGELGAEQFSGVGPSPVQQRELGQKF